jgi:hypothetical protein
VAGRCTSCPAAGYRRARPGNLSAGSAGRRFIRPAGTISPSRRVAPGGPFVITNMTAVLVRFHDESGFSEAHVRQVAEGARTRFVGVPGLRSKAFTIDPVNGEAVNIYFWETEAAAKAFFSPLLIDRVTELYGVRPAVQFMEVVSLVENRES